MPKFNLSVEEINLINEALEGTERAKRYHEFMEEADKFKNLRKKFELSTLDTCLDCGEVIEEGGLFSKKGDGDWYCEDCYDEYILKMPY